MCIITIVKCQNGRHSACFSLYVTVRISHVYIWTDLNSVPIKHRIKICGELAMNHDLRREAIILIILFLL